MKKTDPDGRIVEKQMGVKQCVAGGGVLLSAAHGGQEHPAAAEFGLPASGTPSMTTEPPSASVCNVWQTHWPTWLHTQRVPQRSGSVHA